MSPTLFIIKSPHSKTELGNMKIGDQKSSVISSVINTQKWLTTWSHQYRSVTNIPLTWKMVEKWLRTLSFNKVDLMNTYSTWTIRTSFVSYPDNSVILSGLIWGTSDWVPIKMTCEWIVSVHIKYFNSAIFCGSLKELLLETSCPLDLWKKSRWLMTFGY